MNKKAQKTQAKEYKTEKSENLVPVTLKQNAYIGGTLYKAGETVKIKESLKKSLVTSSPEVYK